MIVRTDHKLSRDSSPELFSDQAECGDGIADSGGSREHSWSSTNAKEEDAPGNLDVIEMDRDDKFGCLYPAKHQRCAT